MYDVESHGSMIALTTWICRMTTQKKIACGRLRGVLDSYKYNAIVMITNGSPCTITTSLLHTTTPYPSRPSPPSLPTPSSHYTHKPPSHSPTHPHSSQPRPLPILPSVHPQGIPAQQASPSPPSPKPSDPPPQPSAPSPGHQPPISPVHPSCPLRNLRTCRPSIERRWRCHQIVGCSLYTLLSATPLMLYPTA